MALFKRRKVPKVVSLIASDRREAKLNLVFKGSQIHLDAHSMTPGLYTLKVKCGEEISLQDFTVGHLGG